MAYITTAQLQSRLGATLYARLTDRVNGTTADSGVAQQIVDESEALADSYFAKRFVTPIDLVTYPELANVLEARVLDVAEYHAWRDSPFVTGIPERIRLLHEDATAWFVAVAAGSVELPASLPPAAWTTQDDSAQYSAEERKFTTDELDGL